MKVIEMKKSKLLLLFILSSGFTGLCASPMTAFLLAQSYKKQRNEQQKQHGLIQNLKILKRKKERSPEHYAMVFQAMQKAVDLN